jgi:hypothetical protein
MALSKISWELFILEQFAHRFGKGECRPCRVSAAQILKFREVLQADEDGLGLLFTGEQSRLLGLSDTLDHGFVLLLEIAAGYGKGVHIEHI